MDIHTYGGISLQVLGNVTEFQRAVKLVIDTVSFDKDSTVQVFEANIRYECYDYTLNDRQARLVDTTTHLN